jgi:hypothetical protein
MPTDTDYDAQDTAEVLDETNLTDDGEDIANFDEIQDVYDVTQAEGDGDEDDFDDEDLEDIDDELEGARDDEGQDVEREPLAATARDRDTGDARDRGRPKDFEA